MKEYYLGLDMGTNSVGWAVTDTQYNLMRAKGKELWGVRLFDEANSAAERRSYRVSRRRRQREVARLGLLKELFGPAIDAIDPGFYERLSDSKYHMQERMDSNKQPYALFADKNYTDIDYYKQYPTIFHLRKELLESTEAHDVRLVYLALANLFKRRGHFLNDSISEENNTNVLVDLYSQLQEKAQQYGIDLPVFIDCDRLESILGEKGTSRTKILEKLMEFLQIEKKQKGAYQIAVLLCGMSGKLVDIFGQDIITEEYKKLSVAFRETNYEENIAEIQSIVGKENFELIEVAKGIHDKGMLSSIMRGYDFLSQARVAMYEKHKLDLSLLKTVLKKYDKEAYHDMFRVMQEGNYSAYVGSVNSSDAIVRRCNKGRSKDGLYKTIRNIIKKFPQDDEAVQEILKEIENGEFMPKQLTFENGIIPNQIHLMEMKKILSNAETYLPFLRVTDSTGLTVSEKIIAIYKFQIPYYVGPLGTTHKDKAGYNVWAERKEAGRVYPWNFEEKIDVKLTAEKFINRMVRHCSYLNDHKALPKNSMLYEKFQVLDELNNLRVYGEKLSVEQKQKLFVELFSCGKKVTMSKLYSYLVNQGILNEGDKEAISGIDGGFKNSLTTVAKFYGVMGKNIFSDANIGVIEDIVFWATVYGNDKKLLRERIQEKYPERFSTEEMKRIQGFKFDGWGRLSKEFLEMEGVSKEDGVVRSFICALWETNANHMELLSDRYTYIDKLQELTVKAEKTLSEWSIDDLEGMYLSAPVRRMLWQTISIINEIEKVLGNPPKRVFVEVTRGEGEKNTRTLSRKQKLFELYKALGKEANDWKKEIEGRTEAEFRIRKLYLYYLQMGRCMYTGESIDLDELLKANSKYDIDHIYPRHFIKDDSIENNLVLVNKENNAYKSDTYPIDLSVRNKQKEWWGYLCKKGFISTEKYNRLVRATEFSLEEKAMFINRQLVETSQGTKAITEILKQAYPSAEIVFSKAGTVSEFRKKFDILKVRCINNYHHAHDAYLNIVVGNTYFVKFTRNPLNFLKEAEKNPAKEENRYHMNQIFDWNVSRNGEVAWIAERKGQEGTILKVKKLLDKKSILVTRHAIEKHGGITQKATIWSAKKAKTIGYLPVKMSDSRLCDVTRYGGVTAVAGAGYSLLEYKVEDTIVRSLEQIPIYISKGNISEVDNEELKEYFMSALQEEYSGHVVSDLIICRKFIPLDSLIKYNGFYYYLGGKTNDCIWLKNAVELQFDNKLSNYVKKVEKALASAFFEERDQYGKLIISKENNVQLFSYIREKYMETLYKNQAGTVGKLICAGQDKFIDLSLEEQCYVLMQIINYCHNVESADLRLIGGAEKSGKNKMNKKIAGSNELILICQSITGLFEAEINLLTI